ncbi:MAG: hypothetical protein Q4C95_09060 [Planctomycetia bacterium]|nr:hypothetical protein [Planctomycetia bacterium]
MEPIRKFQTGLLAIALGFTTTFSFGVLSPLESTAQKQAPSASMAVNQMGNGSSAAASDSLIRSQELLLKARHSLMRRDIASAERFVQEAQKLNAVYGDVHDRPDYVLPLIGQYKTIQQNIQQNGMSESLKRDLARNYLEQAEALRLCQDYDNADSLVMEAANLNVTLDNQTINREMDVASVSKRIRDDRLAMQSINSTVVADSAPLTGISEATKQQVIAVQQRLIQVRQLISAGQYDRAEAMINELQTIGIPENAFAGGDSPAKALTELALQRSGRAGNQIMNASFSMNSNQEGIRQVQGERIGMSLGQSNGYLYVQEADAALRAGDKATALKTYQDSLRYAAEMDADTIAYINESIAKLNAPDMPEVQIAQTSGIDFTKSPQEIQNAIAAYIAKTNQIRQTNPAEALDMLHTLRSDIETTDLNSTVKGSFAYSVDMAIANTEQFFEENGAIIALDNRNKDVLEQIRQKREHELQVQNQLAEDTEKFNMLLEEGRFEEAIILAKKCQDYSRNSVASIQMYQMAIAKKQVEFNNNLKEAKNLGNLSAWNDVEMAAVPNVSDTNPLVFGDHWEKRAKNRKGVDLGTSRSEADMEILKKLDMVVTLPFNNPMPLETVAEFLRTSTGINIIIDPQALAEANFSSDTPIETRLSNISLKNYLKHALSPFNLTYVVEDEALTITSKKNLSSSTRVMVYPVGDLVVPVPNFNTVNPALGMTEQYRRAFDMVARRGSKESVSNTLTGLPTSSYGKNVSLSPNIVAQIQSTGASAPISTGNGAEGGGVNPDELVQLITTVIEPESWEDPNVGEPQFFSLSNSLVIRQRDEVHEEISKLLEKLRSLNDLQIAVEVRFITISDEYFEKIGVNFNVTLPNTAPSYADNDDDDDDDSDNNNNHSNNHHNNNKNPNSNGTTLLPNGHGIYGLSSPNQSGSNSFTDNLAVNFTQNSYGFAVPQFGSYDASVGAQMGFAILSDIESFFFMSAAEGDRRTNVLQAPKVTMFNGQMASVSDMQQVPYVYSVIPVVGEFAVAQQPVVTVVNEGQFMTVQAIASNDRRFVRMTVVPFFSKITDKDRTFKFEGSDSVTASSSSSSKGNDLLSAITDERESTAAAEQITSGTTVQQPIVSSFQVYTTVNVPDGGTVLLGGIKRLSEGRNEGGVPILSKIPYLKRLFSNSAIGRETTSLMMMVTPRIIIQEEEEQHLTGVEL